MQKLQQEKYNPVLLYKEWGKTNSLVPDLPAESFLLCLQTKHQKEVLQQFGANVLCMDSTHGTNHYDFKLITVMVADQFGQGLLYYPVLAFKDSILVLDHVTFRKNSWLVHL